MKPKKLKYKPSEATKTIAKKIFQILNSKQLKTL